MTWEEFKRYIDKKLKEENIDEDVLIDYIDVRTHVCIRPEINFRRFYGLSIWT